MYRVTVGTQYGGEHYDQSFDAPDWQTALIAAAEVVKIDPAFTEYRCGLGDDGGPCRTCKDEPESACDLGDEPPKCPACGAPQVDRLSGVECSKCDWWSCW